MSGLALFISLVEDRTPIIYPYVAGHAVDLAFMMKVAHAEYIDLDGVTGDEPNLYVYQEHSALKVAAVLILLQHRSEKIMREKLQSGQWKFNNINYVDLNASRVIHPREVLDLAFEQFYKEKQEAILTKQRLAQEDTTRAETYKDQWAAW